MADSIEFGGDNDDDAKGDDIRKIGKYEIHETLGKGAYSWVKRGVDTNTGNIVAMKFLNRTDKLTSSSQSEQVRTEIKSLTLVRHANVIKLLAFNLSAKYPTNEGEHIKTVLLVLEYCPGGELFDLLYYAKRLDEMTARSYFRQLMLGLQAIHKAGVAHRDIKPQNLLLDDNYCMKITDFGLSKIIETEEDRIMKTTYVGTRGYQAPELLKNKAYTNACDIFSSAVVLFILVAGYPPFEGAHKTDKWFKSIAQGDWDTFWHHHRKAKLSDEVKELLAGMFCYKAPKRITLEEIFSNKWFNGPVLKDDEMKPSVIERVRQAKKRRKKDPRVNKAEMEGSVNRVRDIKERVDLSTLPSYKQKYKEMPAQPLPGGLSHLGLRMFYTRLVPYDAILYLNYVVTTSKLLGSTTYDPENSPHSFNCAVRIKEVNYQFSITAYGDPKGVHTLIHFQTLVIPDSLVWARLYREVLTAIFKHDILLDDLPVVAQEKDDVKEEEKELVLTKPVRTELVIGKPIIAKLVIAKPVAAKPRTYGDGYK